MATTAPDAIAKEAKRLRVPMTHVPRDPEYVDVLAYRIEQEIHAIEFRLADLRGLHKRVEEYAEARDADRALGGPLPPSEDDESEIDLVAYDGPRPVDVEPIGVAGCVGCLLEDVGDGENGPKLLVLVNPSCPLHASLVSDEEVAE